MSVLCNGCGEELPVRAGRRGRRAEYHGPTCRQRARRARLAVAPESHALLARLDQAEHALAAARRAVLNGQDPNASIAQLNTAATALLLARRLPGGDPARTDVTKYVTLPTETPSSSTDQATLAPAHETPDGETQAGKARPVTPMDVIDPDSVQVSRSSDFEVSGNYHALTTVEGELVLVGILRRSGRAAWQALTPPLLLVPGGPWRTRQDALLHLLLNQDRVRRARPDQPFE